MRTVYLYALDRCGSISIKCFKGYGAENASGSQLYFECINKTSLYEGIHIPSTPNTIFTNHLYDHLIWFDHECEQEAKNQLLNAYIEDCENSLKYHNLQIKMLKDKIKLYKESQE